MISADFYRIAGSTLVLLIGIGCGLGGTQLWRGGPEVWPDVIANETIVRRTAAGLIIMAVSLLTTGIAAIKGVSWGGLAASITTILFAAGGFWGNYQLFGDVRPVHTSANVILAIVILVLLWVGYSGQNVKRHD